MEQGRLNTPNLADKVVVNIARKNFVNLKDLAFTRNREVWNMSYLTKTPYSRHLKPLYFTDKKKGKNIKDVEKENLNTEKEKVVRYFVIDENL